MNLLQSPTRVRPASLSEVAALLAIAVRDARILSIGHATSGPGRHGAGEWEMTCWFECVAGFMGAACRMANTPGGAADLLDAALDAGGGSLADWGLRRWRDGQWELDNLELDYRLRAQPRALLSALDAFGALLNARQASAWELVG